MLWIPKERFEYSSKLMKNCGHLLRYHIMRKLGQYVRHMWHYSCVRIAGLFNISNCLEHL